MGISLSFGPLVFLTFLLKNSLGRQTAVLKFFCEGPIEGPVCLYGTECAHAK